MNEEEIPQATAEQEAIVTVNDPERSPLLRSPCVPCNLPLDRTDQEVIDDIIFMMDGPKKDEALGIAAVQVGYPKRFFVMRDTDGSNLVVINPEILESSKDFTKKMEGCLSIPDFGVAPRRPKSVKLRYMDRDGAIHTRSFTGLLSRVVCHEMDHLDGVLLIDHMQAQVVKHATSVAEKKRAKDKRVAQSRTKEKMRRKARRKQRKK